MKRLPVGHWFFPSVIFVLLGAGYTANLEMILEFMERQLMH
jgi:hypothetical protein